MRPPQWGGQTHGPHRKAWVTSEMIRVALTPNPIRLITVRGQVRGRAPWLPPGASFSLGHLASSFLRAIHHSDQALSQPQAGEGEQGFFCPI